MKQAMKLLAVVVVGAIVHANLQEAQGAAMGSIRGFIKDGQGNPLVGAAVLVLTESEDAKADKVVRKASTDAAGKFIATSILPGNYRIKAVAEGFSPVELAAPVQPNKTTIFDSILLRKVGTLADETRLNADAKYAARRARDTIFHLDDTKTQPAATAVGDSPVALTDRTPELHGYVNAFSQNTLGSTGGPGSFTGANFAVSEQIGQTNLVVSGQGGIGLGAPQRLDVLTSAAAGNKHLLSVALGYGRFTFTRDSSVPRLGQVSLSARDTWQVSGPVLIVYGMDFSRFTEGKSGTSVRPRFGVAVDARPGTRFFAGLTPGSSVDEQSRVNLESGEIVFAEPKPTVTSAAGDPVPERSYRLEFGAEQILSDKSSLQVMAFVDTVTGHGVGLLALADDRSQPTLRSEELAGRTSGMRVVYHRRLNRIIEGSIGYAFGEGQRLEGQGITTPDKLFSNGLFHVVSAKVDTNFASTGTKISAVLRLAPAQAVFAIDPFQGQLSTYDPNLSISLTQELPGFGFLPGQWQAILDLRNLFDQQASVSDDRQELVVSRYHRLIRVGVQLRF